MCNLRETFLLSLTPSKCREPNLVSSLRLLSIWVATTCVPSLSTQLKD